MDVLNEKRALRERLVRSRATLPPVERAAASRAAAELLETLPAWRAARAVALYAPIGAETDTSELAERALRTGKRIAWPLLRSAAAALDFANCAPSELVAGPMGTRQPPPSAPLAPLAELDLVVVPGVAFDAEGHRLGRGRGHYDATLALLPEETVRVGLAFDLQMVPSVPCEAHDARLDVVVTERRLVSARRSLR
jgi:5-formyltetrahydrofolate cyclo-ligase